MATQSNDAKLPEDDAARRDAFETGRHPERSLSTRVQDAHTTGADPDTTLVDSDVSYEQSTVVSKGAKTDHVGQSAKSLHPSSSGITVHRKPSVNDLGVTSPEYQDTTKQKLYQPFGVLHSAKESSFEHAAKGDTETSEPQYRPGATYRASVMSLKSLKTSLLHMEKVFSPDTHPPRSLADDRPTTPQIEPVQRENRRRDRSCSESRAMMLEPIAVAAPDGQTKLTLPTLSTPDPSKAVRTKASSPAPLVPEISQRPAEPFFDADAVLPTPETESKSERLWYQQCLAAAHSASGRAFMRLGTLLGNETRGDVIAWSRCHLDAVERARGIALIHTLNTTRAKPGIIDPSMRYHASVLFAAYWSQYRCSSRWSREVVDRVIHVSALACLTLAIKWSCDFCRPLVAMRLDSFCSLMALRAQHISPEEVLSFEMATMFCPLVDGRLWFSMPHAYFEELVQCIDDLGSLQRSSPEIYERLHDHFTAEIELATFDPGFLIFKPSLLCASALDLALTRTFAPSPPAARDRSGPTLPSPLQSDVTPHGFDADGCLGDVCIALDVAFRDVVACRDWLGSLNSR